MAEPHPIEGLLATAMESIRSMVDVNTILGEPVETPNGTVILPISRVSFGFAAGGREFAPGQGERQGDTGFAGQGGQGQADYDQQDNQQEYEQDYQQEYQGTAQGSRQARRTDFPFAGGSGAGISLSPVGFLVVQRDEVRLVSVHDRNALYDRLIDLIPRLMEWAGGRRQQAAPATATNGMGTTAQGVAPAGVTGEGMPAGTGVTPPGATAAQVAAQVNRTTANGNYVPAGTGMISPLD